MERFTIRPDYTISRIIKGGWHLAGGHGKIDKDQAIKDMLAFVEAGITTFDCADIYTGVEEMIGCFLKKYKGEFSSGALPPVQIHTKYVPDYDALARLKKSDTESIIDRSLRRLGVERLDLVQFAWWDYKVPGYVEAAMHLAELQQKGKIRYLGVTNFNENRLREILEEGVEVVTNQVQYSILDHRAERGQQELAKEFGFSFLTYGSVAGGFLSDRYLNALEPRGRLENRSLTKYQLIIEEYGSWKFFQETLHALRKIADKYQVGITEVAVNYVLQKPNVGAAIIGARNTSHLDSLSQIGNFTLDEEDLIAIKKITNQAHGPSGPFYDLERDKTGKHGAIMKYNLNSEN